ncbi:MAG TPA: hypothetical protein VIN32_04095, partial [Candidatus Limnocylindria bacterium]
GSGIEWLDRLAAEHDNVRAALRWSVDSGQREIGLRIAAALWRFWQQRGHLIEGRAWFDRLIPDPAEADSVDAGVLAAAHTAAGGVVYWQNDQDQAEAHYLAAYELDRAHDRLDRIGDDLYNLAFVAIVRKEIQTGRERFEESGKAFAAAGQSDRLADSTAALGALEMRAGNLDKARDLMEEGRRLHAEQGNHARATDNTMVLSNIYLQRGEVETAREYLRKAVAAIREMKDVARFPLALDLGAAQALSDGRPADALRLLAAAALRRAQVGGGTPNFVVNNPEMIVEARAAMEQQGAGDEADKGWAEGETLDDDALAALIG